MVSANSSSGVPGLGGRAFFQRRVAQVALFVALGGLAFWILRALLETRALSRPIDVLLAPSIVLHFVSIMPYAIVGLLTIRGTWSSRVVSAMEAAALVASCVCYQLMGADLSLFVGAPLIVVLASMSAYMGRAALVPSPPRLTAALGVAIGIPLLVTFYRRFLGDEAYYELANRMMVAEGRAPIDIETFALGNTFGTGLWWVAAIVLGTATSHVIYGLREAAEEAAQLGQYTLVSKIGEGGMGAVYRAEHALLRRPTAIKLLLPERAGDVTLARFEREVQLTAELSHPNTVTIFDYGRTPDGIFYYAMEYLDGATLETVVEVDGPQPIARVVHIIGQVLGALGEAHDKGLIHRDIKPANVILCERGGVLDVAKVVDFGLVKPINNNTKDVNITNANIITGTPLYMAPESITDSDSVDARSDIYSLGALAYHLLTGTHVFDGTTTIEVCSQHLHTAPEPPSKRLGAPIDTDLETLVMQCLEKNPNARPQGVSEAQERLASVRLPKVWSSEDARRWWAANRSAIERSTNAEETETNRTIAVDLDRARS